MPLHAIEGLSGGEVEVPPALGGDEVEPWSCRLIRPYARGRRGFAACEWSCKDEPEGDVAGAWHDVISGLGMGRVHNKRHAPGSTVANSHAPTELP